MSALACLWERHGLLLAQLEAGRLRALRRLEPSCGALASLPKRLV